MFYFIFAFIFQLRLASCYSCCCFSLDNEVDSTNLYQWKQKNAAITKLCQANSKVLCSQRCDIPQFTIETNISGRKKNIYKLLPFPGNWAHSFTATPKIFQQCERFTVIAHNRSNCFYQAREYHLHSQAVVNHELCSFNFGFVYDFHFIIFHIVLGLICLSPICGVLGTITRRRAAREIRKTLSLSLCLSLVHSTHATAPYFLFSNKSKWVCWIFRCLLIIIVSRSFRMTRAFIASFMLLSLF